ncbi:MAG TPA: hypothetical protein VFX02_11885 [Gammaproteobacteria bacterium]|nr:hypothetical protein [Gammaproteobacteria bacterium]
MKTLAPKLILILSLLPALAPAEDEEHIGRLFMEPGTRQQLDESRKQNSSAQQLPVTEDIDEAAMTSLKVDGVVMRHDGSTEVWINGVRSNSQLAVRRAGGNRFQVSVPGGGEITLKPGQIYSFEMQRVIEGYEADKELAKGQPAETDIKEAAPQTATQAAAASKTAAATGQATETKTADPANGAKEEQFNEAELVDQDVRIKLMEEGNEQPEQGDGARK